MDYFVRRNPPNTIEQYFTSLFDYFRLSYAKSMEILMSSSVYFILCFICDVAAEREKFMQYCDVMVIRGISWWKIFDKLN